MTCQKMSSRERTAATSACSRMKHCGWVQKCAAAGAGPIAPAALSPRGRSDTGAVPCALRALAPWIRGQTLRRMLSRPPRRPRRPRGYSAAKNWPSVYPSALKTELVGDCVLQVVRLIDDQAVVFRQHPVLGGGVGHQQRMVDDDRCEPPRPPCAPGRKKQRPPISRWQRSSVHPSCRPPPGSTRSGRPAGQRELALVAGLRLRQPDEDAGDAAQLVGVQVGRLCSAAKRRGHR